MNLDLLKLQIDSTHVQPDAGSVRPPSWPPPPDWAPILDRKGNPVCRYSDSIWPLDVWAGHPLKINFGDGNVKAGSRRIDRANANLLRQYAAWLMWGHRGCRTAGSLADKFNILKPFFAVCSQEGILASDLMHFQAVIDKVAQALAPSKFSYTISVLHDLLDARDDLGFCLLNPEGIRRLAKLQPDHQQEQTAYIPPRIWAYQLNRLRECLQDYSQHQERIECCFIFCAEAYSYNFGSLREAMFSKASSTKAPFQNKKSTPYLRYHGNFKRTSDHFGVTELLERWVGPFTNEKGEKQIGKLSQFLDLVSWAGLAYLINYSLMRIEEGMSMRSDCLLIEQDEKYGSLPMLVGRTTKTASDCKRLPTSFSVIHR